MQPRRRGRTQPRAQPRSEVSLGQLAFGESHHDDVLFFIGRNQLRAVESKECSISDVRRSFVPVYERMVARKPVSECGSEIA